MAEALSEAGGNYFGNVTQAAFLGFLDQCADSDREVAEAVAARKDLRSKIKAAGIPLKAFDRARKDGAVSGEVREREEAWYRRLMAWQNKPFGFQASMDFSSDDPDQQAVNVHQLKTVDNEGFDAGKNGKKRETNPYTPGSEMAQRWDSAWLRGQAEIASTLKPGSAPAAAANGGRRGRGRPRTNPEASRRPRGRSRKDRQPELGVVEGGQQEPGDQVH